MKSLRFLAFAALVAAVSPAYAGFYFTATGLYNSPQDIKVTSASAFKGSLKDSTGFAGAFGYKLPLVPLRAEAEIQYFKNDLGGGSSTLGSTTGSGDSKQFSGFLNGYVDLPSYYGLSAYAGAGLGMARVNLDNFSVFQGLTNVAQFSGRKDAFAWQLLLGVQYHLFGQATLHAGYRLVQHDSIALTNAAAVNALQHVKFGDNNIFELGVSIGF